MEQTLGINNFFVEVVYCWNQAQRLVIAGETPLELSTTSLEKFFSAAKIRIFSGRGDKMSVCLFALPYFLITLTILLISFLSILLIFITAIPV